MKFLHLGCSHINSAASAVSVHQHMALLNSGRPAKRGKNVCTARSIDRCDWSGYVSVGCLAWDRGTEMRVEKGAPYGWCCLKRVKPGNSSHTLMMPCLLLSTLY